MGACLFTAVDTPTRPYFCLPQPTAARASDRKSCWSCCLRASRIATTRLKTIPPYVKVSSFVTISTSSSAHISLCSVRRERTQQFDLSNFCNCWKMALPVSTAIDSLTAALRSNIIPNQEYLLQGSILDSSVEVLLHRLRGLCDNVDAALETFHDHEMCFSISKMFYFLLYFRKY